MSPDRGEIPRATQAGRARSGHALPQSLRPGSFSRRPTFRIGNGMLFALHQHPWLPLDSAFSEFRAGLDHVAFGCADEAEVEKWCCRLDELGIEHGQIRDTQYGSALSFRDPDGIALEFFAPPGT